MGGGAEKGLDGNLLVAWALDLRKSTCGNAKGGVEKEALCYFNLIDIQIETVLFSK